MEKSRKKYFTQRELEKHINARLKRERKKNSELEVFKNMTDELVRAGIIDANSYAEAAERLMKIIAERTAENKEDETGETTVNEDVVTAEYPAEDNAEGDKSEQAYQETTNGADDLSGFRFEAAGEEEPEMGVSGDDPVTVLETEESTQKGGSDTSRLAELCRELLGIIEDTSESDTAHETGFFARRDACSTGFSKRSALGTSDVCEELTLQQREIARRAGLSYREYAKLLHEIPENRRKRKQLR